MADPPRYDHQVRYQGDVWVQLAEMPRLVAESYRRLLSERGVVSVIRTPFQWVMSTPVIEIETGGYMGDVALYVPQVQEAEAVQILEGDTSAEPDATDMEAQQ
ncbi:hypothetical protein [Deinococcus sonorensis]|uniref:DUF2007 domain-containing protein n=2 Tax=Deinococcus sonorensis TaxID=309891 RepID=A0AAU7UD23_9DEIO